MYCLQHDSNFILTVYAWSVFSLPLLYFATPAPQSQEKKRTLAAWGVLSSTPALFILIFHCLPVKCAILPSEEHHLNQSTDMPPCKWGTLQSLNKIRKKTSAGVASKAPRWTTNWKCVCNKNKSASHVKLIHTVFGLLYMGDQMVYADESMFE